MESFLESLEEEVYMKNNIVTYKWIVKHLKVPSNVAKQMLYEFVEKQKSSNVNLSVTYMISGDRKSPDGTLMHEVLVIPDSQLDSVKSKFEIVTGVHVYAVHKSPLQDYSILYSVDYQNLHSNFEDGQRGYLITCSTLTFRCTESPKNVVQNEISNASKEEALHPKTNDQPQINRKRPNGDLDRLFSSIAKKEKKEKSQSLPLIEQETPLTTEEKLKNNTSISKKHISDKSPVELFKKNTKNSTTKSKVSAEKIKEPKKKIEESAIKTEKSKTRLAKRRRIIQMSDSSEDEDQSDHEEPLIKMPVIDDAEYQMSPTSPEKASDKEPEVLNQTRHKRVLVNETTLDKDGYLVTQKIWKDETEIVKENKPSVVKPKSVESKPVLRQKQSTLMNFFKKQ